MNECLKYVRWHGRRRLYSARVPLVLWLVTDLVILVLPQSICTRIAGSSNLNFLILLFNMIFFLAGACLFFYPTFVLGAPWFTNRRTLEQLTGISTEKQILSGLFLNLVSIFPLCLQAAAGTALMRKFAHGGTSYFQLVLADSAPLPVHFLNLAVIMPCFYLFFYLLFGRRGLKLPAWLAAAAVYSFTGNLWMFFPISTEWQAALFAALLRLLLCILLIPACARIVRKRGY